MGLAARSQPGVKEGQARGHELLHYDVGSLTLDENDRLFARVHPVRVQRIEGDHFSKGEGRRIDGDALGQLIRLLRARRYELTTLPRFLASE